MTEKRPTPTAKAILDRLKALFLEEAEMAQPGLPAWRKHAHRAALLRELITEFAP